jgi:hypothetical protein
MITITREESKALAPYPKNGNVQTQAPTYVWVLRVDGKWMTTERTLRAAKGAATYYGESVEIVR